MSPWRWTQIKGSKHVGQWICTINVIELYILLDCEYKAHILLLKLSLLKAISPLCIEGDSRGIFAYSYDIFSDIWNFL
jgi:hypothetical protein